MDNILDYDDDYMTDILQNACAIYHSTIFFEIISALTLHTEVEVLTFYDMMHRTTRCSNKSVDPFSS